MEARCFGARWFIFSSRSGLPAALAIAVCVELVRLVHTPWLDALRLTTAGALLLGRIFSVWNMVAYAAGILCALGLDRATAPVVTPDPKPR
jgi:hypothetical protein